MTRKDFELIARIIKNTRDIFVRGQIARSFADGISGTHANFDRARFLQACGETE